MAENDGEPGAQVGQDAAGVLPHDAHARRVEREERQEDREPAEQHRADPGGVRGQLGAGLPPQPAAQREERPRHEPGRHGRDDAHEKARAHEAPEEAAGAAAEPMGEGPLVGAGQHLERAARRRRAQQEAEEGDAERREREASEEPRPQLDEVDQHTEVEAVAQRVGLGQDDRWPS